MCVSILKSNKVSLSSRCLLKQRMTEVVGTTGAISRAKLQTTITTTNQHKSFFTGRMPFLSPNQQCQSTEGKNITHSWTCLPQAHLGVFQLCFWPLMAPGYLGEGLPCLSSALWCQYPKRVTKSTQKKSMAIRMMVVMMPAYGLQHT